MQQQTKPVIQSAVDDAPIAIAAALIYLAGEAERAGLLLLAERIRALAAETAEQQGRSSRH